MCQQAGFEQYFDKIVTFLKERTTHHQQKLLGNCVSQCEIGKSYNIFATILVFESVNGCNKKGSLSLNSVLLLETAKTGVKTQIPVVKRK